MTTSQRKTSRNAVLTAVLGLVLITLLGGCSNVEKAKPRPEPARVESIQLDVPQIMRGTVASEAVLDGYQPVVVRGYGLVVGLNGTGSRDTPAPVRAQMLMEMARRGFGRENLGYGDLKPEAVLDSMDTAVVIVEAVIPPGAVGPRGTRHARIGGTAFDVRVYADPRTETKSLEGGRLYTTELRPGPLRSGGGQAAALAVAAGPIFVNPFAEPGAIERDALTRTTGIILGGGEVSRDMPLKLRLAQPSHVRASVLQNSINSRFPREPGQPDPTARGESDSSIVITVPPSFRDRPEEFVALLQHSTIRLADPDMVASSVRRLLLADPSFAPEASLRWHALGARAIPIIRDLYDHPEELPRFAALYAGAKLSDALVVPHLVDLAMRGPIDLRIQSIDLLARMAANPQINAALRGMLDDEDVDVRLAAYEGLLKRGDALLRTYRVDNKFLIDVIPSTKPMIYVTQFGQPRVAIFGDDLGLEQPLFARAWSDRLMLKDLDDDEDEIEVYYRSERTGHSAIHRSSPSLPQFVHFLGHTMTPERPSPGLGMSYGEMVGTLYQIWRQNFIKADFKAEQDRILAAIMRYEWESTIEPRPEFSEPESEWSGSETPVSDLDRLMPGDPGAFSGTTSGRVMSQ